MILPADLDPEDFYSAQHELIFSALLVMAREGRDNIGTEAVRARLHDAGKLVQAGGLDVLLALTDGVPNKTPDYRRLKRLRCDREIALKAQAIAIAACAGQDDQLADALLSLDRLRARRDVTLQREPHPVDRFFLPIGAALSSPPPPRRWLLTRPDEQTNGATWAGFLGCGKVGMLAAAGGAGKTALLVSLALSVATGRRWLDHYLVASPGRVLLVLGEEDEEEVWRRLYHTARAMRLTDAQIAQASEMIVALPLAGVPVQLVGDDSEDTGFFQRLKQHVRAERWSLILVDPLSRFAGADAEKDAAAATRFVQALESLTSPAWGAPAVLVAHHTHKLARDGGKPSTSNARGSSALTDGVRWAAEMDSADDGMTARLTLTKSNYGPRAPTLELVREHEGTLRAETDAERDKRIQVADAIAVSEAKVDLTPVKTRLVDELKQRPGQTKKELVTSLRVRKQFVGHAVDQLALEGILEQRPKFRYRLSADTSAPKGEQ